MDLSRYPKPYGPETIVIPMTMELPESFVAYMEAMSAIEAMPASPPEPSPWRELSRGDPPVPVPLAAYQRAAMAEAAAAEAARRLSALESRPIMAAFGSTRAWRSAETATAR